MARDLTNSALPKLVGDSTYTLTGWFKLNAIGGQTETQNTHFIDTDSGGVFPGYRISMIAGLDTGGGNFQQKAFDFVSNGSGAGIQIGGETNPDWAEDTWYFFAARMQGPGPGGLDVFLIPEGTAYPGMFASGTGFAPGATASALQVGRDTGNGAMDGLKDDFSIWDRDLSDDEIKEIDEAGLQGIPLGQLVPPVSIPGDVNDDGLVNIFDINLVSAHWGETGPVGDANEDMQVNIFDINLISSNWTPTGATAVPEPGTLVLALLGLSMATGAAWQARRRQVK